MLTEVDIPNKDLHLAPGMYANTTFPLQTDRKAMMVPIDAIVEGDQPYVLIVDDTEPCGEEPGGAGNPGTEFLSGDQRREGGRPGHRRQSFGLSAGTEVVCQARSDLDLTTFRQTSTHDRTAAERPGPKHHRPREGRSRCRRLRFDIHFLF